MWTDLNDSRLYAEFATDLCILIPESLYKTILLLIFPEIIDRRSKRIFPGIPHQLDMQVNSVKIRSSLWSYRLFTMSYIPYSTPYNRHHTSKKIVLSSCPMYTNSPLFELRSEDFQTRIARSISAARLVRTIEIENPLAEHA